MRSLYGLVAAGGEFLPLMEVLVRLAGLRLHTEGLSSPICCVPPEIKTAAHILAAARALYPRALVCAETCFGDLQRLNSEGALRVLCIESAPRCVHFCLFFDYVYDCNPFFIPIFNYLVGAGAAAAATPNTLFFGVPRCTTVGGTAPIPIYANCGPPSAHPSPIKTLLPILIRASAAPPEKRFAIVQA